MGAHLPVACKRVGLPQSATFNFGNINLANTNCSVCVCTCVSHTGVLCVCVSQHTHITHETLDRFALGALSSGLGGVMCVLCVATVCVGWWVLLPVCVCVGTPAQACKHGLANLQALCVSWCVSPGPMRPGRYCSGCTCLLSVGGLCVLCVARCVWGGGCS